MKIIIVGATGTLGKKITASLEKEHEVITVGTKSGDILADITQPHTIDAMFKQIGSFDALVSAAGSGHWGPLKTTTATDFQKGLTSKLLGQVNLVLTGQQYINPKGSFTLTSGVLADDPVLGSVSLAAVNGALNSFAFAAAVELENNVRINVISPGVVEDSPELFPFFPGHIPVAMDRVVQAYHKSIFGIINGQTVRVF